MGLKQQNLVNIENTLVSGQKLIKIGNSFIPIDIITLGQQFQAYVTINISGTLMAQKIVFDGTSAVLSGQPESLTNVKTFNTSLPEPSESSSNSNSSNSINFYKCAYVTSNQWGGYKLIKQTNGKYILQNQITSGLSYICMPKINKICLEDGSIQASYYFSSIIQSSPSDYYFYAPLSSNFNALFNNQTISFSHNGQIEFTTIDNINCANLTSETKYFNLNDYVYNLFEDYQSSNYSFSIWINSIDDGPLLTFGSYCYIRICRAENNSPLILRYNQGDSTWYDSQPITTQGWHNIIFTYNSNMHQISLYYDGQLILSIGSQYPPASTDAYIGRHFYTDSWRCGGYITNFKIYNRTLTSQECYNLSQQLIN